MLAYSYTLLNNVNGKSFSIGQNSDGTTFCGDGRGLGLQEYPAFELEVRNEERDKSGQHGIWDFYSFYGKRNITFSGKILANSHADLVRFQNLIRETLALPSQPSSTNDGYVTLSWTDALGVGWEVDVKIQQDVQFRRNLGLQTQCDFFFSLKADQPYILSSTSYTVAQLHGWRDSIATVPSSVPSILQDVFLHKLSLYQAGTAQSPATYRAYGPLTNPKITKLEETHSNETLISDFETSDGWTGDMTSDTSNYQTKDESQKLTSTGTKQTMSLTGTWDLSDPQYISFYFYVDDESNIAPPELPFPADEYLAGYWALQEESGTDAYDLSGLENNGTDTNVTISTDDYGNARLYDGASGYTQIPYSTDWDDPFTGGGTTIFIITPASDGEGNFGNIWSYGALTPHVRDESGGVMKLGFQVPFTSTSGVWETTSRLLTVGTTHVCMITYDDGSTANDPRIWIDGVEAAITEVATPAGTYNSPGSSFDFYIGNTYDDTRTFDGKISQVRIYKGIEMDDSEAIASYNNPSGDIIGDNYIRFIETKGAAEYKARLWDGNETIQDGWNYFLLLREQFEQIGSPSWNDITEIEFSIKARTGTTLNISFDELYCRDIDWTERKLEITGTIASGDYYDFNTEEGTIEDSSGTDKSTELTTDSEWFYMDPRQNLLVLESDANPLVTFTDPYEYESGLNGYWPLNEGSGNFGYDSFGGNDLSLNGATGWLQTGATTNGIGLINDSGCYLEGTSPFASSTMTTGAIMFRYKFDTFSTDQSLLFRAFGDSIYPRVTYVNSTDTLTLQYKLDGTVYSLTVSSFSSTYSTSEFLDFVIVFDCLDTGTYLYINGSLADSDETLGTAYDTGSSLWRFGSDTDASYYGNGVIDEIVTFNGSIPDSTEIAEFSERKPTFAVYQDQLEVTYQHAQL